MPQKRPKIKLGPVKRRRVALSHCEPRSGVAISILRALLITFLITQQIISPVLASYDPRVEDRNSLDASDGSPSNAIVIDGAGNVGLTDPTPDALLDVNGSVIIEGTLTLNGTTLQTGASWVVDGGNSTNATVTVGTNDDQKLALETNGVTAITIDDNGLVGIGDAEPTAQLMVNGQAAATIGQIIKGASSQSANLTEWQNNSATVLGKVDSTGVATFLNMFSDSTNYSSALGLEAGDALAAGGTRNIAIGYQALTTSTTDDDNTAVGYHAMRLTTTGGIQNTAIGSYAMRANTTGGQNVSVGSNNLESNTTGSGNTSIGFNTMEANTTGSSNVAIGASVLSSNTTGSGNIAVGSSVLGNNTTAGLNVAFGSTILNSNTTGSNLVGIGVSVLNSNTTGSVNVAVGGQGLAANTTGDENVGFGYGAGAGNTTGSQSTSLGSYAGHYNKLGSSNVAVGYGAGFGVSTVTTHSQSTFVGAKSAYAITTGGTNIALGYQAGDNLTSGSKNIIIGTDIDAPSATTDNQLNIGNIIFGTGVSGTGTTIAGNIGIGDTSPDALLDVNGSVIIEGTLTFNGTSLQTATDLVVNGGNSYGNEMTVGTNDDQGLALETNGVTAITVDNNGNVGIGTSSPEDLLEVQAAEATDAIITLDADDGDDNADTWEIRSDASDNQFYITNHASDLMTVASNGDVGIGTTNPGTKLDIRGIHRIVSPYNPAVNSAHQLFISDNDTNYGARIGYDEAGSSVMVIDSSYGNNDASALMSFRFADVPRMTIIGTGNVGIGTTSPEDLLEVQAAEATDAIITLDADDGDDNADTWEIRSDASDNQFYITNHASDLMTVASNGDIGIGTTNPGYALDLSKAVSGSGLGLRIYNTSASTADNHAALILNTATGAGADTAVIFSGVGEYVWSAGVDNSDSDKFKIGESGTVGTSTWFTIASAGNVGIGDTSPDALLDVNGNAIIEGTLTFNGTTLQTATDLVVNGGNSYGNEMTVGTNDDQGLALETNGVTAITITDNGLVGVGTTSPVFALDIGGYGDYLDSFRAGYALVGGHSGTGYDIIGYNTTPTTSAGAYNYTVTDSASHIEFYDGGFKFYTAPSGTAGNAITRTQRFTILQNGDVGIGTSGGAYVLDVAGSFNASGATTLGSTLAVTGTTTAAAITASGNLTLSGNSANILLGSNYLSGDGADEGIAVDSAGKVGIGTAIAAPGAQLQVTSSGTTVVSELLKGIASQTGDYLQIQDANGTQLFGIDKRGHGYFGSTRAMHNYGTNNTFYGAGAGNITLTTGSSQQNTGIGTGAMAALTTAAYGVAVGYQALKAVTTGNSNVAIGTDALKTVTTGGANTAVGESALANNTATGNSAFGSASLYTNTSGTGNTGLGYYTLMANTTGGSNTAVGNVAMQANTTGTQNVAVGSTALDTNTTGSYNTAIGTAALTANTTGDYNVGIGTEALSTNTTASRNVAIGYRTLASSDTAQYNTAVGHSAGYNATTGSNNTFLGYQAGYAATTGANNITVGYQAGDNITNGNGNIMIGYNIDAPSATDNGQLSIGNLIYGTNIDGTGLTHSTGSIGIKDTSPDALLDINGTLLVASTATIGSASGTTGAINFKGTTSGTVTLTTAAAAGTYTLTLPADDGTDNDVLTTDGSGVLTWEPSGGSGEFADGGDTAGADRTLGNNDDYDLSLETNGVAAISITDNGLVGIGDAEPTAQLFVNGQAAATVGQIIKGAASQTGNFLELQNSAGTKKLTITKDGYISPTYSGSDGYMYSSTGGVMAGFVFGRLDVSDFAAITYYSEPSYLIAPTGYFGFNTNTSFSGGNLSGDVRLYRDAAANLALRNSTTAQAFRVYNTYTSSTNYERGKLEWDTNVFNIGTENGSAGGTARALAFHTDDTTRMTIAANGDVGIGTTNPSALLQLGLASSANGTLALAGNTSGVITIKPASTAGTYTLTLPADDGDASEVLTTDGSGNLTWEAAGAGSDEFNDGGDTAGGDRTLGNNDDYDLSLETNGVAAITITDNGLIGIGGATSPSQARLEFSQTTTEIGSLSAIKLYESTSNSSEYFQWYDANTPEIYYNNSNGPLQLRAYSTRVLGTNAAGVTLTVKGAASQSANLTEWQDSSATVVAKVSATGFFTSPGIRSNAYNSNDNSISLMAYDGGTTNSFYDGSGVVNLKLVGSTGAVFNDSGVSTMDFRMEGDTDANLFTLDAGLDKIGIGLTTPNEKLTIEGAISLDEIAAPSATAGYGKVYVDSTSNDLSFVDNGGTAHNISARVVEVVLFDWTTDVSTGDGAFYYHVPAAMNGLNVTKVHAQVITAGVTGVTTVNIYNITGGADILTTGITIDSTETGSHTAATPAVIDLAQDDLTENDLIRFDVDTVSTTAPKGLIVTLELGG